MYNAKDLALYVIQRSSKGGKIITNLKLQKILYYIQGYFYREYDAPAFNEEIQNWTYGPVVPVVYYNYCSFGSEAIFEQQEPSIELLHDHKKLLNRIIDKCTSLSSFKLVEKPIQKNHGKVVNGQVQLPKMQLVISFPQMTH